MIVPVRNIKKLQQQARCFRPIQLATSPPARAHLRRVVAEAIVDSVALLWRWYFSVSFQLFVLRYFDDCTCPQHQETAATSSLFSPPATRDFATFSRSPSEGCCGSHCWFRRFCFVVRVLFSVLSTFLHYVIWRLNPSATPRNYQETWCYVSWGVKHKIDPLTVFFNL